MALKAEQILVGGFDQNISYLVYSQESSEACIVDPAGDFSLVQAKITELQLDVVAILLTHTHADHMDALPLALTSFPVPVFVHEAGAGYVEADSIQPLIDGNEIELGESMISVVHTPGHSSDSVVFLFTLVADQPALISGDTLFIDGCGRTTDSEVSSLFRSLQLLKKLPPQTLVLPGHDYGPVSVDTLANQLLTNRFLQAGDFSSFSIERLGYVVEN